MTADEARRCSLLLQRRVVERGIYLKDRDTRGDLPYVVQPAAGSADYAIKV